MILAVSRQIKPDREVEEKKEEERFKGGRQKERYKVTAVERECEKV